MNQNLYIMSVPSGHRKIGIAADAKARRISLQGACYEVITIEKVYDLISEKENARKFETEVHQRLAHRRVAGEWFRVTKQEAEEAFEAAWDDRHRRPWKTPRVVAVSLGRPRIEDRGKTLKATAPWKAAGMSRASWYRRQKEKPRTAS